MEDGNRGNLCTLTENSITQTILDKKLKFKLQNKQLDLGKSERWKSGNFNMPNAPARNNERKVFVSGGKLRVGNGVPSFCNTISLKMESFQFQRFRLGVAKMVANANKSS